MPTVASCRDSRFIATAPTSGHQRGHCALRVGCPYVARGRSNATTHPLLLDAAAPPLSPCGQGGPALSAVGSSRLWDSNPRPPALNAGAQPPCSAGEPFLKKVPDYTGLSTITLWTRGSCSNRSHYGSSCQGPTLPPDHPVRPARPTCARTCSRTVLLHLSTQGFQLTG